MASYIEAVFGVTTVQPAIHFKLRQGVPPSLSNLRGHWSAISRVKAEWKLLAFYGAAAARVLCSDPSLRIIPDRIFGVSQRRIVTVTLHRVRLLDDDNAYSSAKPVIDGLKGQVIVDDSRQWARITVEQVKVAHHKDQHVAVRIERWIPPA